MHWNKSRWTHPCNAVIVDVVEDRKARLWRLVDVEFGVVGLGNLLVSGLRPWIVAPSDWVAIGGLNLLAICRPEPSVEVLWQQVFTAFTTCDVDKVDCWERSRRDFTQFTYRWNHTSDLKSKCMAHHSPGSTWRWDCSLLASRWRRHPCSTRGRCYVLPASQRA